MCGLEEMIKNETKIDNPLISEIKLSLQVQSPNPVGQDFLFDLWNHM